jgi:predicted ArsR family transcriptional regulator
VTARRYLEHLAVEGLVELSMRYGATGRPEHLYALPRWRRADQAHVLRTAEGLPELLERDAWPSSVALA